MLILLALIPDVHYTPYIGYMFVDEIYRGNRLSQQLILYAMNYFKSVGFDKVYIVSDHINLYEKYGFHVVDCKIAPWGSEEKNIYRNYFNKQLLSKKIFGLPIDMVNRTQKSKKQHMIQIRPVSDVRNTQG